MFIINKMTSYVYWMMGYEEEEIVASEKTVRSRHLLHKQIKNNKHFKLSTSHSVKEKWCKKFNDKKKKKPFQIKRPHPNRFQILEENN